MTQSDWPSILYIVDTTLLFKPLLYMSGCSEPFVVTYYVFVNVGMPSTPPNHVGISMSTAGPEHCHNSSHSRSASKRCYAFWRRQEPVLNSEQGGIQEDEDNRL
jgi:hypothetical protein